MTIDTEIKSRIESFASDLAGLIRRAVLEGVHAVLSASPAAPTGSARTTTKAASASHQKTAKPTPKAIPKPLGTKRPPAELAKLTENLFAFIKAHPGLNMEAISKGTNTATSELTLPIKKLLADKRIGTKGQKRATRYAAM